MPTGETSWRLTLIDVGVAVAAVLLQLRDVLLRGGDWTIPTSSVFNYAVWVCVSVLLLLRRRWPRLIAVVALTADPLSFYPAAEAVAFYTVGSQVRSHRWQVGLLAACAATHVCAFVYRDQEAKVPTQLASQFIIYSVTPLLLGLFMSTRQRLLHSLQERARHIEREQILVQEKARADERRRIAREMHDVVAHRVSHLVMHAGVIEVAATHGKKEAIDRQWLAQEAASIRDAGRDALRELREVLTILKTTDGSPDPLAPVPGLDDLPALVDRSRTVGLPVVLDNAVRSRLSVSVQQGLYRIVQEALTNVVKHAAGAPTRVALTEDADTLVVHVTNGVALRSALPVPGSGSGLAGLRERVRCLKGSFESGPCPGGGFHVRAVIPIASHRLVEDPE
ncbi:sensor histidine kinase [Streptomyces phaeochromogenes]|uniref:sensor histidine kinase n=1 Tax=Streptomyces phaeochromogenes TaxID=1923 RepID=UPI002DD86165|nr:histidine kinase [Streptomyces phaeochromogenes]WRZ28866.1 histidine kinase [Streptomyces phaeochromogenes]